MSFQKPRIVDFFFNQRSITSDENGALGVRFDRSLERRKILSLAVTAENQNDFLRTESGQGGDNSAETARAQNSIPACVKVFSLQGGFYMDRLPLLLRLIMKLKNKEIAAGLKKKASLDPREQALLTMATTGRGDPAAWDVSEIIDWCKAGE